jgi:tetratricopeptide (TPR) repeat protein
MWTFLSLAHADPPLAAAPSPSGSPDELLHVVRERLRHGEWEEARELGERALAIPGDHQRTAQYLIAMSWEFGGDPAEALSIYEALATAYGASAPEDVVFRKAECLGRLERYDEARATLRPLRRGSRPELDELKIDVLDGIWALELGRERKGYRALTRTLAEAPAGVGTYYQAAARHVLLDRAVSSAAELAFVGSDRDKARAVELRTALIRAADDQLAALVLLGETEVPVGQSPFVLDGFVALGRAHRAFGEDLLDESPLTDLTPEQLALNRQLLTERAAAVWTRGTLYYDRGLQLAARLDWTGEPVATMQAEYSALVALVDGAAGSP